MNYKLLIVLVLLLVIIVQGASLSNDRPLAQAGLEDQIKIIEAEIDEIFDQVEALDKATENLQEALDEIRRDVRRELLEGSENLDDILSELRDTQNQIVATHRNKTALIERALVKAEALRRLHQRVRRGSILTRFLNRIKRIRGGGAGVFFVCIVGIACADVTEAAVDTVLGPSPILGEDDRSSLEERIAELERIRREIEERNEGDIEDIDDRIDDSEDDLDDLDLE